MNKKICVLILLLSVVFISGCIGGKIISRQPTLLEFKKPIVVDDISITFDSVRFTNKINHHIADEGYKFVIINITAENIGLEENNFPFYFQDMEIKVNKGYVYTYYTGKVISPLRPEDTEIGYVVFEILNNTYPIELYINDWWYGKHILPISQDDYVTSK